MTCRKRIDDTKTEASRYLGISLGENLPTAQAVSGIKVARAWLRLWCGTWAPVAPKATVGLGERPARPSKGGPQAAETARGRVPTRGPGAFDKPVWPTSMLGYGPPVWGLSMFTSAGSATGAWSRL